MQDWVLSGHLKSAPPLAQDFMPWLICQKCPHASTSWLAVYCGVLQLLLKAVGEQNCRFLLYRWIYIWRYLCCFIDWIGLDNICRQLAQSRCSAFTWLTLAQVKSYQKLQDSWSPCHHKENILLLPSPFQLPSSSSSQPYGSVPSFVLILPHPFTEPLQLTSTG